MGDNLLDLSITTAESWHDLRSQIVSFARQHPEYHKDFNVIMRAIDAKMREASQITVDLNRNPNSAMAKQRYADKIREANDILYPIQQNLLLLMLARPRND